MVAYILQMLFAALSLLSVVIMIVMIIKGMRTTKKQWWILLLPIMFLFMAIAYRFDWVANSNNDISRFFDDFEGLKVRGFFYEMRYADEFSWLWRVIAYAFCRVENLHWFPVFAVAVVYIIYFYILIGMTETHNLSALDVLLCLLLQLALMPLIMTATACRNTIAYAFFSMGVYMYYRYGLKDLRVFLWMLAGVLTHTTVAIGVLIFMLSLLGKRYRMIVLLCVPLCLFLGNIVVPLLESSTNVYLQYFVEKWNMYIAAPNQFDKTKNAMIFPGLLPLFLCASYWYLGRNLSPHKESVVYLVSNMAVTIGVSGLMSELFLRLCYPTSLLMPLLWAEMKDTVWKNNKNAMFFLLLLICVVLVLFAITGAGWLYQLYWFFEG